jgi:hypothetical protein
LKRITECLPRNRALVASGFAHEMEDWTGAGLAIRQ